MQKTAKFYEFRQNNSGGGFDYDEDRGISVNVFVQAFSADEANRIAEDIGLYFDGTEDGSDCPCCGDRWYEASEYDGMDKPQVYGFDLPSEWGPIKWIKDGYETFIHYLDGQIVGKHK